LASALPLASWCNLYTDARHRMLDDLKAHDFT
jgi:hypothetical protein